MEDSKHAEDKPWLAIPRHNRENGCSMRFQSVTSNNVYDYELAACTSGKTICGSSSAVLSSPPDRNPYDYILVVIHGEERELAYYSALTQTWIEIQEAGRYYDDIIFRLGFYAVDEYGKVILCEPGLPPTVDEITMPWLLRASKVYLVENPNVGYETYKFEVHLLESYGKRMRVEDMGDWAVFLGQNESMALSIRVVKGAKSNCIYFTDDNFDAYKYGVVGGHHIGVYDTGEESSKPLQCCQSDIQCAWPRLVWLTPYNNGSFS
ncbi:hypothetical protein ES288_A05G194100v1 [Gossypium darwinii]|uniref:KIB1-4 beta-propeller domain-containing protein n=2 Tax=Gossypium TaxID=3633 RepID=A0A5D2QH96_GOSTO|nr:hypothetical protein ES288_A05G194100v1 [Gossypium darwinii]TYI27739.1 hypothetical protein ES332_A05G197400v1 [Gossypium tomentosum]